MDNLLNSFKSDVVGLPASLLATYQLRGYEHSNIYNIGTFQERVNVRTQMERAMVLIPLLEQKKILKPGCRIGIVGAGFAGISASAAALLSGYDVDILDTYPSPMYLQRNNTTRKIHPHILDFPVPGFGNEWADLPILNWRAGYCNVVVNQILRQYNLIKRNFKANYQEYFGAYVYEINPSPSDRIRLDWKMDSSSGNSRIKGPTFYDVVILAVGFNLEDKALTYWGNDDLDQSGLSGHKAFLISGTGDGGLIDTIRLRLANFNVDEYVCFMLNKRNRKLLGDLQDMMTQAKANPPNGNNSWLYGNFEDLYRSKALVPLFNKVGSKLRNDVLRLTLNGQTDISELGYLSASWMHLLLIYTFNCIDNRFEYKTGDCQCISSESCQIKGEVFKYDRIILRHGPNKIALFDKMGLKIDKHQPLMSTKEEIPVGWSTGRLGSARVMA